MINNYSFGRIVIDGKEYTSDVIVYPDGHVENSWWRKNGHELISEDIPELIEKRPAIIIAGTGSNGMMHPDPKLSTYLKKKGISFLALPTKSAVNLVNDLAGKCDIGACFHLTC